MRAIAFVGSKVFLLMLVVMLSACALPRDLRPRPESIIAADPKVINLSREGLYYYAKGRYPEAELKLRQALYISPDLPNIRFNLALALSQSGSVKDSLEIIDALIESANTPKQAFEYKFAKARILILAREWGAAEALLYEMKNASIELVDFPNIALVSRSLSVLHFRVGKEELSFCDSLLSSSLQPNLEELKRHGRLLLGLGYFNQIERNFQSQPGMPVDADTMLISALANYGLGSLDSVAKNIDVLEDLGGLSPEREVEKHVLSMLMERNLLESPESGLDEEAKSALSEKFFEEVEELKDLRVDQVAKLYWPFPVVDDFEKLLSIVVEE